VDSIFLAVAGIALLVMGVVGFVAVVLFFAAAAVRYALLPRMAPFVGVAAAEARRWVTPSERPRPALVQAPVRGGAPRR